MHSLEGQLELYADLTAEGSRRTVGQDGFTYNWVDLGSVEASERPSMELSYEKEPPACQESTADDSPQHWLQGSFGGDWLHILHVLRHPTAHLNVVKISSDNVPEESRYGPGETI